MLWWRSVFVAGWHRWRSDLRADFFRRLIKSACFWYWLGFVVDVFVAVVVVVLLLLCSGEERLTDDEDVVCCRLVDVCFVLVDEDFTGIVNDEVCWCDWWILLFIGFVLLRIRIGALLLDDDDANAVSAHSSKDFLTTLW